MANPPIRPDVQSMIATLLNLFLAFARTRSREERSELEREILNIFELLGATQERSVLEARTAFEKLRVESLPQIPKERTLGDDSRAFINGRIRGFESNVSNPHLSKGARDMLRIPLIEAADRMGSFEFEQANESLDRILVSIREQPVSRIEGDHQLRTSAAVIRAFYKNFCKIPPWCSGRSYE